MSKTNNITTFNSGHLAFLIALFALLSGLWYHETIGLFGLIVGFITGVMCQKHLSE